jgi:hypothetical protein
MAHDATDNIAKPDLQSTSQTWQQEKQAQSMCAQL